jgi:hypothetical protein
MMEVICWLILVSLFVLINLLTCINEKRSYLPVPQTVMEVIQEWTWSLIFFHSYCSPVSGGDAQQYALANSWCLVRTTF